MMTKTLSLAAMLIGVALSASVAQAAPAQDRKTFGAASGLHLAPIEIGHKGHHRRHFRHRGLLRRKLLRRALRRQARRNYYQHGGYARGYRAPLYGHGFRGGKHRSGVVIVLPFPGDRR